ncbi:hypothetical protein [Hymenobacter mucosus]|uniref:MetA-pathway of phenol degradation n=1 Tax=Hymenobacter mucosus TaxID=1411120 RepID=A0A238YEI7_9BACT|nr:hypothetical protein [Hymenobacter mucosus]SNR69470.1 hypothetical protein SAMN06269173_105177 [Hymenobacter mucosus]
MTRFFPLRASSGVLLAAGMLAAASCTAPRAIVSTGKVTPKGEFKVGGNLAFNIPTSTISKTGSTLVEAAKEAASKDTVQFNGTIANLQVAALAYALDPIRPSTDFYVRYGALDRLDVGYKYAFGSHVFDAMYQFLGPVGTPERPGGQAGATYGSIGFQYATQRAKLPSIPFLDNVSSFLGFRATRHDFIVPLVFSTSFGPEEEIGALSYGLVYSYSSLRYGFQPDNVYLGGTNSKIPALPTSKQGFSAFGTFINAKFGYRYAYVIPAVSVYYQNYGQYQLLNNQRTSLKGLTIIPSVGLQFRVPTARR